MAHPSSFHLLGLLFVFVVLISSAFSASDVSNHQPQEEKAVDLNGRGGYNRPRPPQEQSAVELDGRGGYNRPRPPTEESAVQLDGRGGYNRPRPPTEQSDVQLDGRGGYNRPRPPTEEEALYYRGGYGGGYGGRGGYGGGYGGRGGYGGGYGGRGGYGGGYGGGRGGGGWPQEELYSLNYYGGGGWGGGGRGWGGGGRGWGGGGWGGGRGGYGGGGGALPSQSYELAEEGDVITPERRVFRLPPRRPPQQNGVEEQTDVNVNSHGGGHRPPKEEVASNMQKTTSGHN